MFDYLIQGAADAKLINAYTLTGEDLPGEALLRITTG
jgi:hypothetical protein